MIKKLLLASLIVTQTVWALGPTVECRFAALTQDGEVDIDEVVSYTLTPALGISGGFEPYGFELSVFENTFTVGIYLDDEPLSGTQIPVMNVVNLPLGASVFGIQTVFHELVDGLVSLRYECRKVLW